MPRKLAALVATATAAALIAAALTAVSLRNSPSQAAPHPAAAASSPTASAESSPTTSAPVPVPPVSTPTAATSRTYRGPYGPVSKGKVIYLTFDDGPDPLWTPQVLAILGKYGAKATFFELGEMVAAHPGLQERVRAAGHAVGNHSVSHAHLTMIPPATRHHEIVAGPASHCFRPPFGESNPTVLAEISAAGMTQILWTVDPRDWSRPGTAAIVSTVLKHAQTGSIVLMHDGGGDRSESVAALDTILNVLKGRGYSFPALTC